MTNKKSLIESAIKARENAHAPYSKFRVGAAVRTKDGKIYTGCNIETASFSPTICAERVAIWKAVSEGESDFIEIAVAADTEKLTPPCGVCRQVIWEFCGDIPVIFANLNDQTHVIQMRDLLPYAFDGKFLE